MDYGARLENERSEMIRRFESFHLRQFGFFEIYDGLAERPGGSLQSSLDRFDSDTRLQGG